MVSKSVYKKDIEAKFIMTRIRFLKKEIVRIEKIMKQLNSSVMEYNDGKTVGQHPEIKTYNDHIKNINSLYNTLLKLTGEDSGGAKSEISEFIQARNRKK